MRVRSLVLPAPVLLAWLVGCGESAPASEERLLPAPAEPALEAAAPPDVLLVSIDTLRADHLGCYGYRRDTSPVIDALAARGARFETAYSPMSATSPAHATLFTSLQPAEHLVMRNGLGLDEGKPTLAATLAAAGWATAGFVSAFPLDPRFGLARGFEHYDAEYDRSLGDEAADGLERRATQTVDAVFRWLDATPVDRPLFLFVHFFDVHEEYEPPPEFAALFEPRGQGERAAQKALYDGEIRYVDTELGRLLEGLDRARGGRARVTAITSDHGQGLWEHGWYSHNAFTYDDETRVPLVFEGAGVAAGVVLETHAHLVDVAPTLLGLLGVAPDGLPGGGRGWQPSGLDLSAAVRSGVDRDAPTRPVFLQRPHRPTSKRHAGRPVVGFGFGLRYGDWKYFEARSEGLRELYHVTTDPKEQEDVSEANAEVADQLSAVLAAWLESIGWDPPSSEVELDEEVLESLRSLGYLGDDEG